MKHQLPVTKQSNGIKWKNFLIVFFMLVGGVVFSQTDYSKIPVKTTEECKKAEPQVLEATKVVLGKPMNDKDSKAGVAFILVWMVGTEYSFVIDEKIYKLLDLKKTDLLGHAMACMAKFVLENKDKASDQKAIQVGAFSTLADYIGNKDNKVKVTKELQKLLDAKKNNKMAEFVG